MFQSLSLCPLWLQPFRVSSSLVMLCILERMDFVSFCPCWISILPNLNQLKLSEDTNIWWIKILIQHFLRIWTCVVIWTNHFCNALLTSAFCFKLCSVVGAVILSFGFYAVIWGNAKQDELSEDFDMRPSSSSKSPLLLSYKGKDNEETTHCWLMIFDTALSNLIKSSTKVICCLVRRCPLYRIYKNLNILWFCLK